MSLHISKQVQDIRGTILFLSYGDKNINVVETKQGFARGGHYHDYESYHSLISGKIEFREENIETKKEQIKIIVAPATILVSPKTAHLLIALEDSIFVEVFDNNYNAIDYTRYRTIVEDKMKK